jgi:hypothetical protein
LFDGLAWRPAKQACEMHMPIVQVTRSFRRPKRSTRMIAIPAANTCHSWRHPDIILAIVRENPSLY